MPATRYHDKVGEFACEVILQHFRHHIGDAETAGLHKEKAFQQKYLDCGEKFPDYALYDKINAKYPKLTLEVGYANKPTPELARDYIIKVSQGHTRTVVTVDLKYGNRAIKQHLITIYRLKLSARTYRTTTKTYILRDYERDGTYTNHTGFVEFRPSDLAIASNNSFSIPFEEFLDAIDKAAVYRDPAVSVSPSPLQGKM
jgi:hypothetical protein